MPRQTPGTTRPPGPSAKITQGAQPLRQDLPCNLTRPPPPTQQIHPTVPRSPPSCWKQSPAPWPRPSSRHPGSLNRPPPKEPDFLTAAQLAARLGVSRETVRRLAIAGTLPHTVVCRGARKTTRRFPRRFADEFAASGLDVAGLAAFADAWRARVTAPAR